MASGGGGSGQDPGLVRLIAKGMKGRDRGNPRLSPFGGPLNLGMTLGGLDPEPSRSIAAEQPNPASDVPIESEDGPVGMAADVLGGGYMAKSLLKGAMGTGGKMLGKAIAKRAAARPDAPLDLMPMTRGGPLGRGEANGPAPIEFASPVWDDTGASAVPIRDALAGRTAARPRPLGDPGPPLYGPESTPPGPSTPEELAAAGWRAIGAPRTAPRTETVPPDWWRPLHGPEEDAIMSQGAGPRTVNMRGGAPAPAAPEADEFARGGEFGYLNATRAGDPRERLGARVGDIGEARTWPPDEMMKVNGRSVGNGAGSKWEPGASSFNQTQPAAASVSPMRGTFQEMFPGGVGDLRKALEKASKKYVPPAVNDGISVTTRRK